MSALSGADVRATASSSELTSEHRLVWARLGRLEALCARRSDGVVARTIATTI